MDDRLTVRPVLRQTIWTLNPGVSEDDVKDTLSLSSDPGDRSELLNALRDTPMAIPETDATYTRSTPLYVRRVAVDTDDREVEVTTHARVGLTLAGIAGLMLVVLGSLVRSADIPFLVVLLAFGLLYLPDVETDLRSVGQLRSWRLHKAVPVGLTAASLTAYLQFPIVERLLSASVRGTAIVVVGGGVLCLVVLGFFYHMNGLPGPSVPPGYGGGMIPLTMLEWFLLQLLLFLSFAIFPGRLYHRIDLRIDTIQTYAPSQGNASIVANTVGTGRISIVKVINQAYFELSVVLIQTMLVVLLVLSVLYLIQARRELTVLEISTPVSLSLRYRGLLFVGFLVGNLAVLVGLVPALSILYYGVAGQLPVPGEYLVYVRPFLNPVAVDASTFTREDSSFVPIFRMRPLAPVDIIDGSYRVLAASFRDWPLLSSRAYAVGFYLLIFWPVLLIAGGWVLANVAGVAGKLALLWRSTELEYDSPVVPDDITVRVDPKYTDAPVARPMGVLLFRTSIVVSQGLVDELEDTYTDNAPLDAVLAHEVYHLQNRDLLKNFAASVLGIGFGGPNTLILLYNYPAIEAAADDHAVEIVDSASLREALDRIYLMETEFPLPQYGGNGLVDPGAAQLEAAGGWLRSHLSVLLVPYRLFYGRALVDAAHLPLDRRRDRIKDDEGSA